MMAEITFSGGRTPLLVLADGIRVGIISPGVNVSFGKARRVRNLYVLYLIGIRWTRFGRPTRRGGRMAKRFPRLCDAQEGAIKAFEAKENG